MRLRRVPLLALAATCLLVSGCFGGPSTTDSSSTDGSTTTTTSHSGHGECEPAAYDSSAPPGGRDLVYTVKHPTTEDPCYGFIGPSSALAGWVNITLDNRGTEPHVMVLMRLDEGKTFEDAMAALAGADGPPPTWVKDAGGVSIIDPAPA